MSFYALRQPFFYRKMKIRLCARTNVFNITACVEKVYWKYNILASDYG